MKYFLILFLVFSLFCNQKKGVAGKEKIKKINKQSYYGIYILNLKSGYAFEKISTIKEDGKLRYVYELSANITVKRLGLTISMELLTKRVYEASGKRKLLKLREVLKTNGGMLEVLGYYKDDAKFYIKRNGSEEKLSFLPEETFDDVYPFFKIKDKKKGYTFKSVRFDAQLLRNIESTVTIKDVLKIPLQGKVVKAYRVVSNEKSTGITLESLITETGDLLEGYLGEQFKMVKEPEEIAKNTGVNLPDIYKKSAISVTGVKIVDPSKVVFARYEICGVKDKELFKTFYQKVKALENGCLMLTVSRVSKGKQEVKDLAKYLKTDSKFKDSKDQIIKKTAQKIAKNCQDKPYVCLMRWIYDNIHYALNYNPFNAINVLKEKKGDCSEKALLFVAFARSLKIPAREVNGIVFASSDPYTFGYHAWAEIYINGRWVSIDPTWNEFPVDATHIKLNIDNPYEVFKIFGKLKIKVLEIK